MTDATLAFAIGLAPRLDLELEVPFRRVAVDAEFEDKDGEPLAAFSSIHHRTETISGLADLAVNLRWRVLAGAGGWTVDLRPGLTAPTGDTEPDPFALGELGETHQHIFFGTGTWDPQLGLDAFRRAGRYSLNAWLRSRYPLGETSDGYRAGLRIDAGLGLIRPLGSTRLNLLCQLEVYHEEPSRWRTHEARNSGRTDLIAGAGLGWNVPHSPLVAHLLLRFPENLSAQGGQIDPQPILTLGVSLALSRN